MRISTSSYEALHIFTKDHKILLQFELVSVKGLVQVNQSLQPKMIFKIVIIIKIII